jgi:hypothetical protein
MEFCKKCHFIFVKGMRHPIHYQLIITGLKPYYGQGIFNRLGNKLAILLINVD